MVKVLFRTHQRIAAHLGHDDELAPVWFLHVPGRDPIAIHHVAADGPLVRFEGFEATETTIDLVLVAPESVQISIKSDPRSRPPKPIGFEWSADEPSEDDVT